ncbi:MAG: hypothetical protein WAM97_14630 [Acidimicrobiales bacterium]
MSRGVSQAYDLRVSRQPLDPERIAKFAYTLSIGIAEGLSEMAGPWIGPDDLTTLMSVSAWMNRSGADLEDAVKGMLLLRTAYVRASGLDEDTEPTPMLHSDEKTALLSLARYLQDLARRACSSAQVSAMELTDRTKSLFEAEALSKVF